MKSLAASLLFALVALPATAAGFVAKKHGGMSYLLFVPEKAGTYPLILWMHGGGTRGTDPWKIISYGDKTTASYFAREDIQKRHPSIIVAPLCPSGTFWEYQLDKVMAIVAEVGKTHRVDARRMYVLGTSMGGYATWEILARYPGMFAAAMPMCGGGDPSRAKQIAMTPVWAFHGAKDEMVDVEESRRMVKAVRAAGGTVRYSEYPEVEHNVWHRAFAEAEFVTWLFAQRRAVSR